MMGAGSDADARVGVFVCHCGHNIAGRVRVPELVEAMEGAVYAGDYPYMCSDPGQRMLREVIRDHELDAVVVAACSPRLHERTFQRAVHAAGLNPYRVEIANIREQCSWIHPDEDEATEKAIRIAAAAVAKARLGEPLEDISFPVTRTALVIGAGIAGIQAALDIADTGHKVFLVEREPSIGGNMARLSETFPTLDCAQCTLTPKMVEVSQHPNVELITGAEVESLDGYVGNFVARITERPKYVDWQACTGCGACMEKCPAKAASEFDLGLSERPAIFTPFPQAVPNKPTIDRASCIWFGPRTPSGKRRCGACEKICPTGAIAFDDAPRPRDLEVGAVVVATGFRTYDPVRLPEYGAGQIPDVIDGLSFERLLSASGPTEGRIVRPSDGKPVKTVAFVQCAGSRDRNHKPYCSKVCCMVTAKHALLFGQKVPGGVAWVFSIDLRHAGRDNEEFLVRTQRSGVRFVRGKVARVSEARGELLVLAEDTLCQQIVEVPVDLVVLATAMEPSAGVGDLASRLKAPLTPDGFWSEAHVKLRPTESMTAGIFLAGTAQGPRDIPETVAQASGAASKVAALFSRPKATADPRVAVVRDEDCIGCGNCIEACPADARTLDETTGRLEVATARCLGCGACASACPAGAADMLGFADEQIAAMIERVLGGEAP